MNNCTNICEPVPRFIRSYKIYLDGTLKDLYKNANITGSMYFDNNGILCKGDIKCKFYEIGNYIGSIIDDKDDIIWEATNLDEMNDARSKSVYELIIKESCDAEYDNIDRIIYIDCFRTKSNDSAVEIFFAQSSDEPLCIRDKRSTGHIVSLMLFDFIIQAVRADYLYSPNSAIPAEKDDYGNDYWLVDFVDVNNSRPERLQKVNYQLYQPNRSVARSRMCCKKNFPKNIANAVFGYGECQKFGPDKKHIFLENKFNIEVVQTLAISHLAIESFCDSYYEIGVQNHFAHEDEVKVIYPNKSDNGRMAELATKIALKLIKKGPDVTYAKYL